MFGEKGRLLSEKTSKQSLTNFPLRNHHSPPQHAFHLWKANNRRKVGAGTTNGGRFPSTFSCDAGYELIGKDTITCQTNALWSHPEPTCRGVLCSDPGIADAQFTPSGPRFPATAEVACDPGFGMSGPSSLTCETSGTWGTALPTCTECSSGTYAPSTTGPCVQCAACGVGFVRSGCGGNSSGTCERCPAGRFIPQGASVCQEITPCLAGTFISENATFASDQHCSACPNGAFSAGSNRLSCEDVFVCPYGEEETRAPTPTSDRQCAECELGVTFFNKDTVSWVGGGRERERESVCVCVCVCVHH